MADPGRSLGKKQDAAGSLQSLEKAYAWPQPASEIAFKLMRPPSLKQKTNGLFLCAIPDPAGHRAAACRSYYVKGLYYSNTGENAQAIQWFDETIRRRHQLPQCLY